MSALLRVFIITCLFTLARARFACAAQALWAREPPAPSPSPGWEKIPEEAHSSLWEKIPEETAPEEEAAPAQDPTDQSREEEQAEEPAEPEPEPEPEPEGPPLAVAQVNGVLNVRSDGSLDAEVVGLLPNGGVATILEPANESGWLRIESGDITGYVYGDYVKTGAEAAILADSASTTRARIQTGVLRVRAAPTTESDVISLLCGGDEVPVLEDCGGWYRVSTPDGEGYICADFADAEVVYPTAQPLPELPASAPDQAGMEVVNYAMQFLGNPYVWGGSSLTSGTDCSGFTMAVYAHFGVSLPHYDAWQRSCGTPVASLAQALPGDLVCYYGHVGIYMGDGRIIHAANPRAGITIGPADYRQIAAIRRVR